MQKIGFNQHYGLHQAVINRTKTKTRRTEKCLDKLYSYKKLDIAQQNITREGIVLLTDVGILSIHTRYKIDEVVAVAECYEDIANSSYRDVIGMMDSPSTFKKEFCGAGWSNKMFVKAEYMPHRIVITGIRVERLQDISHEDCMKEGIINGKAISMYTFPGAKLQYGNPILAYSALIDKPGIGGKGTWERNPWVVVYTFKLI